MGYVLAMYDVRGIQNYIFRTAKLRDAIGASAQVENIITDTLQAAIEKEGIAEADYCLEWEDNEKHAPIEMQKENLEDKDIRILYIGGGNGYALFSSRELAIKISKDMAEEVICRTYSLQLAVAMTDKTDNYADDYENLQQEMTATKDKMIVSKPIGAPAVVEREVKTGYPLTRQAKHKYENGDTVAPCSTETFLKQQQDIKSRKYLESSYKKLENYITEKGVDSTIAVVHIDGNNMGHRIRGLIEKETDYVAAVNLMRKISYNINHDYKDVYDEMEEHFNAFSDEKAAKGNKYFVMKVLVAGDDITYVCNGRIALSTIEYFCNRISDSKYTMTGEPDKWKELGFSVCGGAAFVSSHFPFSIAYDVAEECCSSAKKQAKEDKNRDNDRTGNWLDFQICKNVQTRDLTATRKREYVTPSGESLLRRPYFIPVNRDKETGKFKELGAGMYSFDYFKRGVLYFRDENNMPRSFSKNLRNTYPLGKMKVEQLLNFFKSRGWKLPEDFADGGVAFCKEKGKSNDSVACWYDALEMMDYFIDMNEEAAE